EDFDVALLANVLHHFEPNASQDILRRCHRALRTKGTVGLWDIEVGRRAKPGSAAAGLFFRLTSSGRCYTGQEYAELLKGTGFRRIRIVRPRRIPGYVLVTGRRVRD